MQAHSGHWPIWAGFLLRWMALLSSCLIFVWFPVTRDVPWANLLLLGIAAALVLMGVRRACAPERPRRATSAGVALATLSVAMCGGFVCATVMLARRCSLRIARPRWARRHRTSVSPRRMARSSRLQSSSQPQSRDECRRVCC
jgi:hypothetical protein